ncbi:uncharacterized protein B0P05DRAFT_538382 [Gilbertella persicaria]|uniref:uncharacterized protein n=1 Tax=Gilbertella persicaria TaxID=101096 RepID=UPI00221FD902|nr:uncharacterized protein B0P05DRAFT_538382 [Gilbertella persicaria]KAI8081869.1 hypothetical protein B0P05DRAFT_538382 [Gilbertella persicaria]
MQEVDIPISSKRQKQQDDFTPSTEEPAGWSMSLSEHGLSLHIVARNGHEYNEFAKSLSRQLARDFGPEFLPTPWDMEEDDEEEELDEDEYLVTIPVCSTQCLFPLVQPKRRTSIITKEDTLSHIIQSQLPTMLQHLIVRYASLQESDDHLSKLMLHLKLYLPLSNVYCPTTQTVGDLLSTVFIITAYVVSVALLPSLPGLVCPPLPTCVWQDCADYATNLLMDLIFDQGDQLSSYPVILCTLLLAWIHTELVSSSSPQALIGLAIRLLILSDYEQTSPWQALMAALIYLDVYSSLFYAHTLQQNALWPSFEKPKDKETQWMLLLAQVISLFYHPYTNHIRKVDVDEVLTLVRDMEIQEQTLSDQKQPIQVVHYMIKILLFRPFCMHGEQTLTKSTFLDLSTSAADALSQLLLKEHTPWSKGALLLIQDVLDRVSAEFQDGDTQAQLDRIKSRL